MSSTGPGLMSAILLTVLCVVPLVIVLVRVGARRKRVEQLAVTSPAEAARERSRIGHMNKWAASIFLWLVGVFMLIAFRSEGGFDRAQRSGSGLYVLLAFGFALIVGGFVAFGLFGRYAEQASEKADGLPLADDTAVKTCPDCAESVKAAARKCRFCGHVFEGGAA